MHIATQKREIFEKKKKKSEQLSAFAFAFLAFDFNCLAVQIFGDNLIDMAEQFAQREPLLDYGWVTISAFCLTALAGVSTTSMSLGWMVGQNVNDINYRDKKRDLEISLLGSHQPE